jgi:uncharacterized membrane protein YdjX (TVP38/TMEM64 family)
VLSHYNPKITRVCNRLPEKYLTIIVFATRLLPIFNFDIISYAAGLTRMNPWKFALATFLGMLPATYFFAYSGESLILGNMWLTFTFSIILIVSIYYGPRIVSKHPKVRKLLKE